MDYVNYCNEPLFFMKIYNSLSEDKRFEFEMKFKELKRKFDAYYDHFLFNPQIIFKDGFIEIHVSDVLETRIDIREELSESVIVKEDLLDEILQEFNASHGLYVTDVLDDNSKDSFKYKLDFNRICDEIEQILD